MMFDSTKNLFILVSESSSSDKMKKSNRDSFVYNYFRNYP